MRISRGDVRGRCGVSQPFVGAIRRDASPITVIGDNATVEYVDRWGDESGDAGVCPRCGRPVRRAVVEWNESGLRNDSE